MLSVALVDSYSCHIVSMCNWSSLNVYCSISLQNYTQWIFEVKLKLSSWKKNIYIWLLFLTCTWTIISPRGPWKKFMARHSLGLQDDVSPSCKSDLWSPGKDEEKLTAHPFCFLLLSLDDFCWAPQQLSGRLTSCSSLSCENISLGSQLNIWQSALLEFPLLVGVGSWHLSLFFLPPKDAAKTIAQFCSN